MLYAFYVPKAEPLNIVYRIMVMHNCCLGSKQAKDIEVRRKERQRMKRTKPITESGKRVKVQQ